MSENLVRIYPLPYITYKLGSKQLTYINDFLNSLANSGAIYHNSIKYGQDRMATALAFAAVYGKEKEFIADLKRYPKRYCYDSANDFRHGSKTIKIITSRVVEKFENTGFRMKFSMKADVFRQAKTDYFILASYHVPNVHFLGWFNKDDLNSFLKSWAVEVYPTTSKMKSMSDLSLEKIRKKGYFV